MRPFYFGGLGRRLYGVHHAAAALTAAQRAAVICCAWGPEYDHAHRAIAHLAAALAGSGIHTLRFDYYGTGDSGGDSDEGDLEGWAADIEAAIDELREISGAGRVHLIGLRLGGYLAAAVADRRGEEVDTLILWDPIVTHDYLAQIARGATRRLAAPLVPRAAGRAGFEVFGHAIGPGLATGFERLDTAAMARRLALPVTLVVSGTDAAFGAAVAALGHDRLSAAIHTPARPCWRDDGMLSSGFVPVDAIHAIVDRIA